MISHHSARSRWPDAPGLWILDARPWPAPEADRRAFVDAVAGKIREVFFGDRRLQALAMACFIRESVRDGQASRLAMVARNLYGITHSIDAGADFDLPRYPVIRFGGNSHDRSVGIATRYYRVYESLDACLKNWLWHLTSSAHFKAFWPDWKAGRDEAYITSMRLKWANGNQDDPPSVIAIYRAQLQIFSPGVPAGTRHTDTQA